MTETHEPPTDRDFAAAWRAAEAELGAQGPSRELDARVQAGLHSAEPTRWALVLAAAVASLALLPMLERAPEAPNPALETTPVTFSAPECAPERLTSALPLRAGCAVEVPALGVVARAETDAELVHTDRGLRVRAGEVRFEATAPKPFRVLVSRGELEALGAAFTVRERGGVGQVHLHSGRLAFVASEGARRALAPGARADWGARTSPEALDREVSEITRLRGLGQAREAERRLARLLAGPLDDEAAEVLSYERGLVLQDDLHDEAGACAHWREHAARFGAGRYRDQVSAALDACAGNSGAPRR